MREVRGQVGAAFLLSAFWGCSFESHDGLSHGMECTACMEVRSASLAEAENKGRPTEASYRRESADAFPGMTGQPAEKMLEDFGDN